ncbi:ArsC/Spx/MgsR family protein (plasmid) [Lactococcus garvieae]|uniref:ArsC/Spx/MgsR family protein n=1 Tax=Lactococcus garvieae TaxID=1363 RepID=UPI0030CDAC6B
MITIYYRRSCNSCLKAFLWLENHNINFTKERVSKITKEHLIQALSLSDKGIQSILKRPGRSCSTTKKRIAYLNELTFNESIDYLMKNNDLLQTPIVMENNKLLIGYNVEEIRKFLPLLYRRNLIKML